MKETNRDFYILIVCSFIFLALLLTNCYNGKITNTHICNDQTHNTCNGNCVCDGFECPSIEEELEYGLILNRDYSITIIDLDTNLVYKSTTDSLGYYINKLQE